MSCYRLTAGAGRASDVVVSREHLHLDPVPRVVSTARQFVGDHAPVMPPERRDVLLLLTSELVTNAVIHARTPLEVGITVYDQSVVVTVHDEDLGLDPDREGGRDGGWGLGLVRELADEYAMERHIGDGKTAWFRISRKAQAS